MKKLFIISILSMLLLVSFVFGVTQVSYDNFECGALNCGSGWNGAWSYSGTCEVESQNAIGSWNMRGVSGCDATRYFDNSAYNDVTVSFYATARSLENGEYCRYYYYDGTTNHELLVLGNGDDDNTHDFYSYNVTQYGVSATAGVRMYGGLSTGDYCYIDNVNVTGDVSLTLNLFVDDNYLTGDEDVVIEVSSSLTNTEHTIELQYPDTTVFCTDTITSPSVPYTVFSTTCDMLNTIQTNAIAKLYVTSSPSDSITKYFNITQAQQDASKLDIQKVYFSPQVLQGGSTEIYAVLGLGSDVTVDKMMITVTFPDSTSRVFGMEETVNSGEYRAFISDTYQTGVTYFNVRAEGNEYYDSYTNYYNVLPFSVEYVANVGTVDEVDNIAEPALSIFGTEYQSGETGTIFLQLFDDNDNVVTNASCYLTIYYPNKDRWYDNVGMSYLENGLYYTDLIIPEYEGVYMTNVYCYYEDIEFRYITPSNITYDGNMKTGTTGSLWEVRDTDCIMFGLSQSNYVEFWFNDSTIGNINISDISEISLVWNGQNEWNGAVLQIWDYTISSWVTVGESFDKSRGHSGFCYDSHVVQREIVANFGNYIDGNNIGFRIYIDGQNKDIYTDEASISFHDKGGYVTDIRGSAEIHVGTLGENIEDIKGDVTVITDGENGLFTVKRVSGTEYEIGETADIIVQVLQEAVPSTTSQCVINIYGPVTSYSDELVLYESGNMTYINMSNGLYKYDFDDTNFSGNYVADTLCSDTGRGYVDVEYVNNQSDTTTSATYSLVSGASLNVTTQDTDVPIAVLATVETMVTDDDGVGGYQLTIADESRGYHTDLIEDEANNILLIYLKNNPVAGTFGVNLSHNVTAGATLNTKANMIAIPLEDDENKIPYCYDEVSYDNTTSLSYEDIEDLECDITLSYDAHIIVVMAYWASMDVDQEDIFYTVSINGDDQENADIGFKFDSTVRGANFITVSNEQLEHGTHTIKGRWKATDGTAIGEDFKLLVFATQAGNRRFSVDEDTLITSSTGATSLTDVGVETSARMYQAGDILGILSMNARSGAANKEAYFANNIDGDDKVEFNEYFPTTKSGSIAIIEGDTIPTAGYYNMKGRWRVTGSNTVYGDNIKYVGLGFSTASDFTSYLALDFHVFNMTSRGEIIWNITNRTLTAAQDNYIGETEYNLQEGVGKIVVRMTDVTGDPVINGTCTARIIYPNNTIYINNTPMTEVASVGGIYEGLYFVDFNLSNVTGIYPYVVDCNKGGKDYFLMNTFHVKDIATEVWTADNRTLTNATNIAGDIWSQNVTIHPNILLQIVDNVWNYVARYIHGEIV